MANTTMEYDDRISFLAEPVVDVRLEMALEFLGRELAFRNLSSQIRSKTNARLDKQQRDFYLREQIRALKSELEDSPESMDEADQLEQKLRDCGMPEESLEEALKELGRLRRMPPDAAEYNVTRTWLDWLISMPWAHATEDHTELRQIFSHRRSLFWCRVVGRLSAVLCPDRGRRNRTPRESGGRRG